MRGRQLIKGTAWSLTGQAITIVASAAIMPFVVRQLGPSRYGVLAFFNVLINYLAYADIGMGTASTRFAAQEECQRNPIRESEVIWTAVGLSTVVGLLVGTSIIAGATVVSDHILHVRSTLRTEAIIGLRIIGVAFLAKNIASVLNTPQLVRLRFDTYTAITYGAVLFQTASMPIILWLGGGLIAIAAMIAAINFLVLLMHFGVGAGLLPQLWPPRRISIETAKPLFAFGITLVFSQFPDLILTNAERISLTYFASVASLAYYSIAYTYASLSVLVALASAQVLVPMFSRLQSSADREHMQQLYCRSLGFLCLALGPAAVLLAVAAKPVLSIWAGPDYGQHSIAACYVLLVGLVFNGLANIPASLLVAANRIGLLARYRYFELPPYLIAVVLFTSRFGVVGAAIAWSARAIVDAAVVYIAAERVMRFRYLRDAPRGRSSVLALLLPPIIALMIGPTQWFWTPIATFISLSLYLFVIWRFILTTSERAWIAASSRRGLGKLSLARVMN